MTLPGVRIRKRRPKETEAEISAAWPEALVEGIMSLEHGGYVVIHGGECPAQRGAVCECQAAVIGPAVRDQIQ